LALDVTAALLLRGRAFSIRVAGASAHDSAGRVSAVGAALARVFTVAALRALRAEAALRVGAAVPRAARPPDLDAVRVVDRSPFDFAAAAVRAAALEAAVLVADVLAADVLAAEVFEAAVFAVLAAAALTVRLAAFAPVFFDFAPALDLLALDLPALDLPTLDLPTPAALAVRDRLDLASASLAPRFALAGALLLFAVFLLEGIRGTPHLVPLWRRDESHVTRRRCRASAMIAPTTAQTLEAGESPTLHSSEPTRLDGLDVVPRSVLDATAFRAFSQSAKRGLCAP
jgi:hypothetical protein